MKKLLAILVITLLAVPMFAGTDILNFMWFNFKVAGSIGDGYNPMSNASHIDEADAVSDDAQVVQFQYYGWLAQFMCGMWGTAFEGDNVSLKMDFFNYLAAEHSDWGGMNNANQWVRADFANSNRVTVTEQIRFKGILDVAGIYTLALGAADIIQWRPFSDGTVVDQGIQLRQHRIHLILENSIKVLEYLNIGLNFYAEFAQLGACMSWAGGNMPNDNAVHTNLDLDFILSLGGSYSFGLSWGLSQEIKVGLDLEKYKDTAPQGNTDGIADDQGSLIGNRLSTNFFRSVPLFQTNANVSLEVLHFAGIENITLTISLAEMLQINKPWSDARERPTIIETEGKYGVQLGFYGFYVGLFMLVATTDYANTDSPKDGVAGSEYDGYGRDQTGGTNEYYRNPNGRGQLGFQLAVGYSRGFFGFDFSYIGQGQIRDYDYDRDNFDARIEEGAMVTNIDNGGLFRDFSSYHRWMNQFDIAVNFSW